MTKLLPIKDSNTLHHLGNDIATVMTHKFWDMELNMNVAFYSPPGDKDLSRASFTIRHPPYRSYQQQPEASTQVNERLPELVGAGTFKRVGSMWIGDFNTVMQALNDSPDADLQKRFKSYYDPAVLLDHALDSAKDSGHSRHAHYFSNLAANKAQGGKFFDVSKLCDYYKNPTNPLLERNKFNSFRTNSVDAVRADDSHGEAGSLARAIVTTIQDYGFNRLSYEGKGTHCIAFATTPDEQNRQQLITVSTPNHHYIPHPTMLPPKAHTLAKGNRDEMLVRVMPFLDMKKVRSEDITKLRDIAERSGLRVLYGDQGNEIKPDNVGILEYNKPDGTHVRLPYLLDWGTFEPIGPHRMVQLQKHWRKDPELQPYYEAAEYLKTQTGVDQLLPEHKEMHLFFRAHNVDFRDDPTRMAVLMAVLREEKLTPPELKAVADKMNALIDKYPDYKPPPEVLHYVAKAYSEGMDMSLPHNAPAKLAAPIATADIKRSKNFLTTMVENAYAVAPQTRA